MNTRAGWRRITAALLLAGTVAGGCAAPRPAVQGESSMNCEKADAATVAAQIKFAMAGAMYQPSPQSTSKLQMRLTLPRPPGTGAVLAVRSNRVDGWLYRGPVFAETELRFDERLAADGGSDTLRFYLFDAAAGQVCAWFNERGERYWRDGQKVEIRLLDEGEFDADRLFKQHEVTLTR